MWSKTKAAINKGYGIPMNKNLTLSRRLRELHPELFDEDSNYFSRNQWPKRHMVIAKRGGKALIKGSPEAKRRMAYLRSLRGKGSYTNAALEGYGGEVLSTLYDQFGDGMNHLLSALAERLGTSINNLAQNPDVLLSAISTHAPSIFTKIKRALSKLFKKKKEYSDEEEEMIKKIIAEKRRRELIQQYQRELEKDTTMVPAYEYPDETSDRSSGKKKKKGYNRTRTYYDDVD